MRRTAPGRARSARGARAIAGATRGARSQATRSNVLIAPGLLYNWTDYDPLREALLSLGHPVVETVRVSALEWAPSLFLGSSFTWYLRKLDRLASDLLLLDEDPSSSSRSLSIVGHSAGGWLARIWLGNEAYDGDVYDGGARTGTETLITLGAPHNSVEEYPFGRVEERRAGEGAKMSEGARTSSLRFSNEFCGAGALGGAKLVCVAGQSSVEDGGLGAWFTRASYRATCGREDVQGDGTVPVESAILEGSHDSLVLRGAAHGPGGGKGKLWYGDAPFVEEWDKLLF